MRRYKKIVETAMTVLILMGSFYIGRYSAAVVESGSRHAVTRWQDTSETEIVSETGNISEKNGAEDGRFVVAVDAGHGGFDSGKVGINDALEKDINLAIAKKLQKLLEKEKVRVVMTRETDGGLYDEGEENKKQQDMKRRCEMINNAAPVIAVSIHQNSYTEESVHGPQVFYYENSLQAQALAAVLQESLNTVLQVDRAREIKANDSYYLLRKTSVPIVIVECGFLSNREEAAKLVTEEYQQQVAEAVCRGVLEYLKDNGGMN